MAHGNPPSLAPIFLLSPLSHPPLSLSPLTSIAFLLQMPCSSSPSFFFFFPAAKCEQVSSSLGESKMTKTYI